MSNSKGALTGEEWRSVVGREGVYEVSSHGRVRRVASGLILKPNVNRGRLRVDLGRSHTKRQNFVHHLVAAAFIGPRPDGKEVNHKDGDRTNNRPDNIEYVTRAENMAHAIRNGLAVFNGEQNGMAKRTARQVAEIRHRLAAGERQSTLCREYGIGRANMSQIATGKLWRAV